MLSKPGLFPQALHTWLLCLIQMIQSLLHMCILQRFCVVQINRTATLACRSSSNCKVCNIHDVPLCIGSPLSRCCRFTTLHALLQRWMRHNSILQSLETIKRMLEAVSLGPEAQNHKLHRALKVSSFSLLSVFTSSQSVSQLSRLHRALQDCPVQSAIFQFRTSPPTSHVRGTSICLFSFTNGQQISQFIQELHPSEGLMPLNCIIPLYL